MKKIFTIKNGKVAAASDAFDTFEEASAELKRWFEIDANKDNGGELLRRYKIKTRDASGRLWTQDEIEALEDGFSGGELVFPEYFDAYELDGSYYCIDDADDADEDECAE